jgi:hypothetical protein
MKPILAALITLSAPLLAAPASTDWTTGFQEGKAELKSASQLAFGPNGILFLADTKAAAIVAVATGDTQAGAAGAKQASVEGINNKIAALLGTTPEEILIDDLAVNPISRKAYLAVSRGRGPAAVPVIVRVSAAGDLEVVSFDKVKFSRADLPNAPIDGVVGEGRRQSNPRQESITDLAFFEDRVLIAGLSNEEFASTLRAIPFPFKKVEGGTSVEIYHGAHGKFETRAPIRTFVPLKVGNEPSVLAAYQCTPLVQFPLKELLPGAKIKGKTIAELGNRNRPLDLIVYEKGGKEYLLIANSARGIMKIDTATIAGAESITEPVKQETKGVPYETIGAWTGVNQLARLDAENALIVRTGENKAVNLEAMPLP